jgi:hypothetical protein
VSDAIGTGDRKIAALEQAAGDDPSAEASALRGAAGVERDVATTLEGFTITTEPLAVKVRAYAALARSLSDDADALAGLLDKIAPMQRALDPSSDGGLERRGDAAFTKITARCSGVATPPHGCAEIDAARRPLAGVTAAGVYAAQATSVEKVAADLARAGVEGADLQADVAEAEHVLLAWAKILRDLAGISKEMDDGQRAMDARLAEEKPLTDAINALCASPP